MGEHWVHVHHPCCDFDVQPPVNLLVMPLKGGALRYSRLIFKSLKAGFHIHHKMEMELESQTSFIEV